MPPKVESESKPNMLSHCACWYVLLAIDFGVEAAALVTVADLVACMCAIEAGFDGLAQPGDLFTVLSGAWGVLKTSSGAAVGTVCKCSFRYRFAIVARPCVASV